jgi:hypothetical protein
VDIGNELSKINSKYPWVTEKTLSQALSHVRADNNLIKRAVDTLNKNHTARNKELANVKKTTNSLKGIKTAKETSLSVIESLSRDNDPLGGVSDLIEMGAGFIDKAADPVMDLAKRLPGGWKALGWVGDAATSGIATAAGVFGIYGKILTAQEQTIRSMINYGLVVGDLKLYTQLRDTVSDIGLSLEETTTLYREFMPLYANMRSGTYDSISSIVALTRTIHDNESIINDYGYSNSELMRRLSEEAEMMYRAGSIDMVNLASSSKLLARFKRSSEYTYAIAELMGVQRSSVNNIRREANDNIDFRLAMSKATATLSERFGDNATDNVYQFNEELKTQLTALFGDDFANLVSDTMNRALYDFPFDTDFLNNMSGELNNALILLGDDARVQFISMMQDGITGSLKGDELFARLRDFTFTVKETPVIDTQIDTPELKLARDLQARSQIAPENYLTATRAEFKSLQLASSFYSEAADSSIDAMDNLRIAFREIIDTLEPDYENSARAITYFSNIAEWLTNIFSGTFGFSEPGGTSSISSGPTTRRGPRGSRALRPGGSATSGAFVPPGEASDLSTSGAQGGSVGGTTGGSYTTGQIPAMRRATPEGMGGNVIEAQSGATVRKGPISQDLMNVLQAAAAEIGVDVRVTSGGQMSMSDYQAAPGTKTNTGGDSPTYYLNGVPVRKGSTRHDAGGAADLNLVNPQTDQNYDFSTSEGRAVFSNFAAIARQLGATGIGAGEGYMGTQTMHVGFGAEATWGAEGTGGFLADVYANTQVGTRSLDDQTLRINQIGEEPTYSDDQIMAAFRQHMEYATQLDELFFDEQGNIRTLTGAQLSEFNRIQGLDDTLLKTFSDAGIDITPLGFGANIIDRPVGNINDSEVDTTDGEDHSSLSPELRELMQSELDSSEITAARMLAIAMIVQNYDITAGAVS